MNAIGTAAVNRFANGCQKLIAQIERARRDIQAEFEQTVAAPRHLLRLALNEAEALAWQTPYPHLVFPALAREKVEAVAHWETRQRSVRRAESLELAVH